MPDKLILDAASLLIYHEFMKEEKEFKQMKLRMALFPLLLGYFFFSFLEKFGVQITYGLPFTFLFVLFLWLYLSRTQVLFLQCLLFSLGLWVRTDSIQCQGVQCFDEAAKN